MRSKRWSLKKIEMDSLPSAESETIEFKKQWTGRALYDITAFSNHRGGIIYMGVRKDGTVIGFDGGDDEQQRISSQIHDNLNLTPQFNIQEFSGKPVLLIRISPTQRLVSYRGRYLTRVGTTNRDMTTEEIGARTLEIHGRTWDTLESPWGIDEVDSGLLERFVGLAKERLPGIQPSDPMEKILGNLNLICNAKLTNAAVLLFTQVPQRLFPHAQLRIGRFKGSNIVDSHDFQGSLLEILDQAMQKLRDMLEVKYDIRVDKSDLEGLQRKEVWEYPREAMREALINALAHRDYTVSANVQIRAEDDHLSLWNPGRLPKGIQIEQLKEQVHPSVLRNPLIAQVLYYAGLVERWGTGTTRIIERCANQGLPEPTFEEVDNGFRLTLTKDIYQPARLKKLSLNERQIKIIKIVKEHTQIRLSDLVEILTEVTDRTLRRDLNLLVEKGLLHAKGEKKGRTYTISR